MSDPAAIAIAEALREDIITGVLPPGERLREVALAARFSTSRVPIREALRELASDGYAELRPNAGARVAMTTVDDIHVLFDLRVVLEVSLVRSAAEMSGEPSAQAPGGARSHLLEEALSIQDAGDEAISAGHMQDLAALNLRFHRVLGSLAQRPSFDALLRQLTGRSLWLHSVAPAHVAQRGDAAWAEHREILDHVHAGAADAAAEVMTAHLERSRDGLIARHRETTRG